MEKDLQDYIENLKLHSLDTESVKRAILRVKRVLQKAFKNCKEEIKAGEISKEQLLKEYLIEFQKESKESPEYQTKLMYLFSQYDSCREILKEGWKSKARLGCLVNQAKAKEKENPSEPLYNRINLKECSIMNLRLALRNIRNKKIDRREKDYTTVTLEEIMNEIREIKKQVAENLKTNMITSIQRNVSFLEEYGYIQDFIKETNTVLDDIGLPELKQVKRNPLPDIEYDRNRNQVDSEEMEEMGVLDVFNKENLEKLSIDDLLVLDLFWKARYFNAKLEISEAIATSDYLNLWSKIINGRDTDIYNCEDEKIDKSLKRDLALTYLLRYQDVITPELEKKYVKYLEQNGMVKKGSTFDEIKEQMKEEQDIFHLANDLVLGECLIVDRLRNKQMEVKKWGVMESKNFEGNGHDFTEEELVIAIEMQNFKGPLIIAMNKRNIYQYCEQIDGNTVKTKLPVYREELDEKYSHVMATMFLPNSKHFKRYINEKYAENPTSPLLTKLSLTFAGGKKIKKSKKQTEDRIK